MIAVGIHFDYHDIDISYIHGLMADFKKEYCGPYTTEVPAIMKLPEQRTYSSAESHLLEATKKLRLSINTDWKRVTQFLDKCECDYIETDTGNNNALEAIRMQLHVPKDFTAQMLRHQVAETFAQYPEFFAAKMKDYLKNCNLTYTQYVFAVYRGDVWCDEYMLGTIGRMFNIRISIISPFFNAVWNLYHDGTKDPDMILIANGKGFRTRQDRISHLSGTRGKKTTWECVGSKEKLRQVETYTGYTKGQMMGIDFKTLNQSHVVIKRSESILTNINELCCNVKDMCIQRDNIVKELKTLDIEVGDFKKLTSYYKEDKEPEYMTRARNMIPSTKRKLEIFPSTKGTIPKVRVKDIRKTKIGEEILSQGLRQVSEQQQDVRKKETAHIRAVEHRKDSAYSQQPVVKGKTNLPKTSREKKGSSEKEHSGDIQQVVQSRKQCKIKQAGRNVHTPFITQQNPDLPSLGRYSGMIRTPEKNAKVEKRQYQLAVNKEHESDQDDSEREEGEIYDGIETDDESDKDKTGTVESITESELYEMHESEMEVLDTNPEDNSGEQSDEDLTDEDDSSKQATSTVDFDIEDNVETDIPLQELVQIPPEMLLPPEGEVIDRGITMREQDQIAEKQINRLEQMIKKEVEQSEEVVQEDEPSEEEEVPEDEPGVHVQNRRVITVQPIGTYDDIFTSLAESTRHEQIQNVTPVKQEQESDDDLIFVQHDYTDVQKEIKSEQPESTEKEQAPSAKRTIHLKKILRGIKQPVPQQIQPMKTVKTYHGNLPLVPHINIKDMTQEAKVKTQPENIQVHKPQPKTIAKQITHPQGKGKTMSVNKDHPFQMNVSGNIGKQTTIHSNVSTLTIQHVTTANVPQQIQPPIDVKSSVELSVYMPTSKVLTQSQLALNYRRRQRMRGKQTVNI